MRLTTIFFSEKVEPTVISTCKVSFPNVPTSCETLRAIQTNISDPHTACGGCQLEGEFLIFISYKKKRNDFRKIQPQAAGCHLTASSQRHEKEEKRNGTENFIFFYSVKIWLRDNKENHTSGMFLFP